VLVLAVAAPGAFQIPSVLLDRPYGLLNLHIHILAQQNCCAVLERLLLDVLG
jgi:hypothetical protein